MAWNKQSKSREWLISCAWQDGYEPTYVTFRHGNEVCWLSIAEGIGRGNSGACYGSLIEWKGNRKVILKHLAKTGCSWFLPFLDKGISGEVFSENEVIEEFRKHEDFPPIEVRDRAQGIVDALRQYKEKKANKAVLDRAFGLNRSNSFS